MVDLALLFHHIAFVLSFISFPQPLFWTLFWMTIFIAYQVCVCTLHFWPLKVTIIIFSGDILPTRLFTYYCKDSNLRSPIWYCKNSNLDNPFDIVRILPLIIHLEEQRKFEINKSLAKISIIRCRLVVANQATR